MTKAYEVLNPQACSNLILLVEHASALFPPSYKNLGMPTKAFKTSLDYIMDFGVADIARALSDRLGITSVLGTYSRLLVDLNRAEDSNELIAKAHGHLVVPANQIISAEERGRRIARYYRPYYDEVERQVQKRLMKGMRPVFMTLHSYPDAMGLAQIQGENTDLPDIDVLSMERNALAKALDASLRDAHFTVGDNFPYDLRKVSAGGIHICAINKGFDAAGVEIRNSILNHRGRIEEVSKALENACRKVLCAAHDVAT